MNFPDWLTWLISWIVFLFFAVSNWLSNAADALEHHGGLITAVATVVLVVVTAKYVRLTQEMVEETKASRGPAVFADLELTMFSVALLIGNTGQSPAHDLELEIHDTIPWRDMPRGNGFVSLTAAQTGISYLAPNRLLRFHVGHIDREKAKNDGWGHVVVHLTFKNNYGSQLKSQFRMDLSQYLGADFSSTDTNATMRRIATEIEGVKRAIEHGDQQNSIFPLMVAHNAVCPICGEAISSTAKKCFHCLEFLESNEEEGTREEIQ